MNGNFWSMGGYALYVWPCFGGAAVVFGWNLLAARAALAAAKTRAARAHAMASAEIIP
ncbi:MAG: heme exporter protein CcmD [Pseudomonadota bacterium]|nr:heme exporter protein CcmD [Pseudomonadota bacterium]